MPYADFSHALVRAHHDAFAMAAANLGWLKFSGRTAHHIYRAIPLGIDEDGRRRTGAAIEGEMMADAERVHPAAQNFAIAIVAHLAEDADVEPQNASPSEVVENHATDGGRL